MKRIAIAPNNDVFKRFLLDEVTPIVNSFFATVENNYERVSESFFWLFFHPDTVNKAILVNRLQEWQNMGAVALRELALLLHRCASDDVLAEIASDDKFYASPVIAFGSEIEFYSQAEIALVSLSLRPYANTQNSIGIYKTLLQILNTLTKQSHISKNFVFLNSIHSLFRQDRMPVPQNKTIWPELAILTQVASY